MWCNRAVTLRRLLTDWRNEEFIELINSAVNGFVLNDFAESNQILCYYFREHKVGGKKNF